MIFIWKIKDIAKSKNNKKIDSADKYLRINERRKLKNWVIYCRDKEKQRKLIIFLLSVTLQ